MKNVSDLFSILGGTGAVGVIAGVNIGTASAWKVRRSIPVEYWPSILGSEPAKVAGVTADDLVRIFSQRADNAEVAA